MFAETSYGHMSGPTQGKRFNMGNDLVATQLVDPNEVTGSGIILPQGVARGGKFGVLAWITSAGPKCEWAKEGDMAIFADGTPISKLIYDGIEYAVVQEKQIGAILPPEEVEYVRKVAGVKDSNGKVHK